MEKKFRHPQTSNIAIAILLLFLVVTVANTHNLVALRGHSHFEPLYINRDLLASPAVGGSDDVKDLRSQGLTLKRIEICLPPSVSLKGVTDRLEGARSQKAGRKNICKVQPYAFGTRALTRRLTVHA